MVGGRLPLTDRRSQFLGTDKDFARLCCEYFSSCFDLKPLSVPFCPHLTPLYPSLHELCMNPSSTPKQRHCFDDVASPLPNLLLAPNLPLAFKQTGFPSPCNITLQLSPTYECIKHCVCVCVPYLLFRPLLASGLWPLLITGRGPGIPWSSLLKIHLLMLACTLSVTQGTPLCFL